MTTGKQVKQCRECRGYSLARQWCGHCNGSGFEPDKPTPLHQSEQLLAELAAATAERGALKAPAPKGDSR